MSTYQPGGHIKVEFKDEHTGASEWMWVVVDRPDEEQRLVFGRLDSQPVVHTGLKLGQALAVSYDNIRDHQRFS